MSIDFDNITYTGAPMSGNKKEVKQVIVEPKNLVFAINAIGYENVLNIIPCNSYDGCIIVVLYKE